MSAFLNRIKKRRKHLARWAKRWPTQAYRLYDRDMPEYPWSVDLYGDQVFLQEYPSRKASDEDRARQRVEVVDALCQVLSISKSQIFLRTRVRQKGSSQYERQSGGADAEFVVEEGGHRFHVNLGDYIDTGLFLDHRNLRREVASTLRGMGRKTPRLLNLFCYTGAFSVWGACAGAHTTSVDLSNTYLEWAGRNLELNGIDPEQHILVRSDILRWLPKEVSLGRKYEVIVLDPPTFSRSKKMERDLDVQRDHVEMIQHCLDLLTHDGVLYFSNNFRNFELDEGLARRAQEVTDRSVPEDFRPGIHRSWLFHAV
jgi:23S rRNA (cytosine1962-C5)-methyltransferase